MDEKIKRIGFIINDSSTDYSKGLVDGMKAACKDFNSTLLIFPVGEYGKSYSQYGYQKRAVASLISKNNLDGLIFSTAVHGAHVSFKKLSKYVHSFSDIPVVNLGTVIPDMPTILTDCEPGLENMITHLIKKHGCKRIALMSAGGNSKEAEERTEVYKKTLEKNGIPFDESLILYGFFSYPMAMTALKDYEDEHGKLDFDAIVCLNDYMAYAAVDYCKQHNYSVPDQIKITGFDDIPKTSISDPTISSINQQIETQGYLAMKTISQMIDGEEIVSLIKVPSKVRYRQSCGCISLNESHFDYQTESYTVVSEEQSMRNNSSSEWLIRKDQIRTIESYFQNTQGKINLFDFTGNFQFVLTNFDIDAAAIVIYEEPIIMPKMFDHFEIPSKAYVLAAYDNTRNFNYKRDKNTKPFYPREKILPEEYMNFHNEPYFVVSLSNGEFQYGYLVYKPGGFDETMYDLIVTMVSHRLSVAFENSKTEEEKAKLDKNNKLLQKISRTDELTKLLNRRGLLELGQESIDLAIKYGKTGLVIFGDMDNLKSINDTYGHDAGDKAIMAIAKILSNAFRKNDIIARIGGDEFAIVATGLDQTSFKKVKEKIDKECEAFSKKTKEDYTLSISLGFTTFHAESFAMSALLLEADAKQYREKRSKKENE